MISERLISVVGLLTILGVSYALSNNRKAVNKRTILWGIALQLILALMILKDGAISFVGFFLLIGLIWVYIYEPDGLARKQVVERQTPHLVERHLPMPVARQPRECRQLDLERLDQVHQLAQQRAVGGVDGDQDLRWPAFRDDLPQVVP